jgi:phosphoribosylformylglycinamidine synthase
MRDVMIPLGIAVDGGKDSLSMATRVGEETVKSPRQLVISAYASMEDITRVVTPDIKRPGESVLIFIDLAEAQNRLGGTALAQTLMQIGDISPDMDNPDLVKRGFNVIQELISKDLILSGHDRSDGGLLVTLLEMAFAGNCGLDIELQGTCTSIEHLFSEELGLVIECVPENRQEVEAGLIYKSVPFAVIGRTSSEKQITVKFNKTVVLAEPMQELRQVWEETSFQLERVQMNPDCAVEEKQNIFDRQGAGYFMSFTPGETSREILESTNKPKVAILRDEGSNSDREMTAAFYAAGFEPWDISMTDLLEERITLEGFRGLAAVGGFSYADVPESAKGWAATILFNERLKKMFDEFYARSDTFSLGICNGCQLFGLLGWVPWQGINPEKQPRFVRNISGRFESRWSTVKVLNSKAIMLKGMEDLVFGIHVAHGEGRLQFSDETIFKKMSNEGLVALAFVDDEGNETEKYPFNPNGSPSGITGFCSSDGRHLAMMPHPERSFLKWQAHWLPEEMKKELTVSPWLQMFQNAYHWCMENK